MLKLMPRLGFLRRTLAIPDERHRLRDADFVEQVLDEGVFETICRGALQMGIDTYQKELKFFLPGMDFLESDYIRQKVSQLAFTKHYTIWQRMIQETYMQH